MLLQDGCADVFPLLGRQNKSGVLKLRNPPAAGDLWLTNGLVVRVEDRGRDGPGRLGELVGRAGFLSRPALVGALGVQTAGAELKLVDDWIDERRTQLDAVDARVFAA